MKKYYIMVAYHKNHETLPITKRLFSPIQVGKVNNPSLDLGIETDADFEDNISKKNPNYCELTALYHAWKNINAECYGLFHYRRYFSLDDPFVERAWRNILFWGNKVIGRVSTSMPCPTTLLNIRKTDTYLSKLHSRLEELTRDYDVILPRKIKLNKFSMKEHYGLCHKLKDYERIENIILEAFPEMEDAVMVAGKKREMYIYNMFIMKHDVFCDYMKWLFFILETFEREYQFTGDSYQDRIFGFISERLLNIYIQYHIDSLSIKEVNVIMPKEK